MNEKLEIDEICGRPNPPLGMKFKVIQNQNRFEFISDVFNYIRSEGTTSQVADKQATRAIEIDDELFNPHGSTSCLKYTVITESTDLSKFPTFD